MDFFLVKAGRRPLVAVPVASRAIQGAALRCYPTHTWKKRLVRRSLQSIAAAGLLRFVASRGGVPLPGIDSDEFREWLPEVCRQLGKTELWPVFVWPADPDRGRIYLYFLDSDGRQTAFCKIGLDQANNELIRCERESLEHLDTLDLVHSRVPRVLSFGNLSDHAFVIVDCAPGDARFTNWRIDSPLNVQIEEYAGPTVRLEWETLVELPWWQESQRRFARNPRFLEALEEAARPGVEVCRAHGDLNRTNVLRADEGIWLLDWERSTDQAPCLTDTVCTVVDAGWSNHPGDPGAVLRELTNRFPDCEEATTRARLIFALAFLGAAAFTPAIEIIKHWVPLDR